METRLLQHECGKQNRSLHKQWDLSQTEVIAHKNWVVFGSLAHCCALLLGVNKQALSDDLSYP